MLFAVEEVGDVRILLEKKVALVTGAGSGIGRDIAYRFAEEGAAVAVSDIDEAGGGETAAKIGERGGRATFIRADTSKPEDNEALVRTAVAELGGLHIAVNNAGIGGPSAPVGEYPPDGWDRVIAVNLSGVFYGMRYQIPALLDAGGGSIVNMASVLGQVGIRDSSAYVAAKHGVVGLTKSAALEYGQRRDPRQRGRPRIHQDAPLGEEHDPRSAPGTRRAARARPSGRVARGGGARALARFRQRIVRHRELSRGRRWLSGPVRGTTMTPRKIGLADWVQAGSDVLNLWPVSTVSKVQAALACFPWSSLSFPGSIPSSPRSILNFPWLGRSSHGSSLNLP